MKHLFTSIALFLVMFQASAQKIENLPIGNHRDMVIVTYTEEFNKPWIEIKDMFGSSIFLDTSRVTHFTKQISGGRKKVVEWKNKAEELNIDELEKPLPQKFSSNGGWIYDDGLAITAQSNPIEFTFIRKNTDQNYMSITCYQKKGLYAAHWMVLLNDDEFDAVLELLDMKNIRKKIKEEKDKLSAFK